MKLRIKPIVAACALAMAAGQAGAVDYYLAAKAYIKTMPDGSPVPMWGYVLDPDVAGDLDNDGDPDGPEGDCFEASTQADRLTCVENLPVPDSVVGPSLSIQPTDSTFRIFLSNGLPEPTSIVIPGQEMPHSALNNGVPDNGPTWNDGSRGSRGGDMSKKVRSYGREAIADGGRRAYVWRNSRDNPISGSGTFMYHTGTWPQKQLYMGLYGLVTKNATDGGIYPNVPYSSDTTLFYSDIDPAFNKSVVAPYDPNYATYPALETAIDRHPSWFLINGEPYDPNGTTGPMGTQTITGIDVNQHNLIRFASAATEKHVPVFQGLYATIHGEDGIQYNWQAGLSGAVDAVTPSPIEQYSIGLPPLKTKDVIVSPSVEGTYSIYDGNGYMTNPTANEATGTEDSIGGMFRKLAVAPGTNQPPVVAADQFTVQYPEYLSSDTAVTPEAFILDVIANDSDINNDPLTIATAVSAIQYIDAAIHVAATCNAGDTSCSLEYGYTGPWTSGSPISFHATPLSIPSSSFDYDVTDGTVTSGLANVTLDYQRNEAPTAADHDLVTDAVTTLLFNALDEAVNNEAGDVFNFSFTPAFDPLSLDPATEGALQCLANGECSYTPPTNEVTAPDTVVVTFDYVVLDDVNTVGNQTADTLYNDKITGSVTITVNPVSEAAPEVVDDNYIAIVDTALTVTVDQGVLANDTEPQGQPMTAAFDGPTLPGTTTAGGGVVLNADGSFTYTPAAGFVGVDTFTYIASDDSVPANDSIPATVTITVGNEAPVAVDDSFSMNQNSILNEAVPGVLVNDTDVDGQALTVSLVAGSGPYCGSLTLNTDGSFIYEPQIDWNSTLSGTCNPGTADGSDTFSYVANDGLADSAAATVNIMVNPQTAPTAINDTFIFDAPVTTILSAEGELLNTIYETTSVLDNDIGTGVAPAATEVNDPENLSPSIAPSGEVTMEIDNMAMGTIGTLEYQFTNGAGVTSNIAQVSLVRYIAVKKSEFNLREDGGVAGNPDNDDWRITGNVDPTVIPPGSTIFAYIIREGVVDPIPINTPGDITANDGTVVGQNSWRIRIDNVGINGPRGDIDPVNDRLRIEAHVEVDDGNGGTTTTIYTYDNVPIHLQN